MCMCMTALLILICGFVIYVVQTARIMILTIATGLLTIFILRSLLMMLKPKKPRKDDKNYLDGWFGRGTKPAEYKDDTTIRPFKIDVSQEVLGDLKKRLANTRLQEPIAGTEFLYGFNPDYLKELVDYWSTEYDWKKHQEQLNSLPQFKTTIEGIAVHFLHAKPELEKNETKKILPLMIIHGWPGCFAEFYKIVPLLTTPSSKRDFVFEVICPSIPGYGFSEEPHQQGFNSRATGRVFMKLMTRLGYQQFFVQGGDWGSNIATNMARYYPERILGLHVNMFAFGLTPLDALKYLAVAVFPSLVSKEEYRLMHPIAKKLVSFYEETAYFHMQSTKPDTLGCAMSDSPAGLAAYLLEKFSVATNPEYLKRLDGGLTLKFSLDELITNCMIYWVTNTFASAARFYKENLKDVATRRNEKVPVHVPCGVAVFPHEVLMYPKMLLAGQLKNIVTYNLMPRGGHFAAMEEPQLLANDILNFVDIVQKCRK